MMSRTSRRPMGSRPDMGSSRKTTPGSCRIACAMPTRWSIPLENLRSWSRAACAVGPFAGRNAGELGVIDEELGGGQVVVEIRLFGQESDARLDGRRIVRKAEDARASGGGADQAHEELQRRSLAGAIGAEIAENFSLADGERKRTQRNARARAPETHAVALFQRLCFDGVHLGRRWGLYRRVVRCSSLVAGECGASGAGKPEKAVHTMDMKDARRHCASGPDRRDGGRCWRQRRRSLAQTTRSGQQFLREPR